MKEEKKRKEERIGDVSFAQTVLKFAIKKKEKERELKILRDLAIFCGRKLASLVE